jgi:predicted TIM-barrel fold metal-dependent hydrolase
MPLQDHMRLISTDDHVVEHPSVWRDRLADKFKEAGPQIVEITEEGSTDATGEVIPKGAQVWKFEGQVYNRTALDATAGRKKTEIARDPYRYDQILRGCYDPVERLKDMDEDGIWAELCFPTFPRFAGVMFLNAKDKELALACVEAYNDFMLDEWCAAAPDRYIPLMILPLWDLDLSVQEIHRTAAKGAKAITFPENPFTLGLPSFHSHGLNKVFAAAEETGMPLCMHFGTAGTVPTTSPDAPLSVMISLMGCNSMYTMVDLLLSPVFHEFPKLKVALSEGGIGWMPYILERTDYTWDRHRWHTGINTDVRPSDLFRRNIWGCFIDDDAGVRHRHDIGIDRITYECDFPHSDCNFPHSRKRLTEMLADVPDDEAHMIAELNARNLFDFH